jgi:hypothetical protein
VSFDVIAGSVVLVEDSENEPDSVPAAKTN